MKLLTALLLLLVAFTSVSAATWYVRSDGSTTVNCLGTSNAAYDGSGTGEACAYSNLQNAIDATALGDDIVVRAGDTFTGAFYLPNKGAGTDYITIKSSALASLPAGVRVSPSQTALMFKLVGDGSGTQGGSNQPVIGTNATAHHYKIQGMEAAPSSTSNSVKSIVSLNGGQTLATLSLTPHHIIIDRCYIHSLTGDTSVVRGVDFSVQDAEVIDSYVSNITGVSTDSHAIFAKASPGNLTIRNNYLEAVSISLQLGYGDLEITPDNVSISKNLLTRPDAWFGVHGNVKNNFEMKGGTNVEFFGNILENNWVGGQDGHSIVLSCGNNLIDNVNIHDNLIRRVGAGVQLTGNGTTCQTDVTVNNNLFIDVNTTYGNGGYFGQFNGTTRATFTHNTVDSGANYDFPGNVATEEPDIIIRDNIGGPTNNSINTMMSIANNGGIFTRNLCLYLPGGHSGNDDIFGYEQFPTTPPEPEYPQTSLYPSLNGTMLWMVEFVADAGFTNIATQNFSLTALSAYKGQGTGGSDIGVNYTTLSTAIGASSNNYASATFSAVTGIWSGVTVCNWHLAIPCSVP